MTIEAPDARFYFDELAIPALDEASQLYSLRNYKLQQRYTLLSDIDRIDQRIQNNLNHLALFSHATPYICAEKYSLEDEADAFVAAYLAFDQNNSEWIQELFSVYLNNIDSLEAIAQALARLPFHTTQEWIQKLLSSHDLTHKYLSIRACTLLCKFPHKIIATLLNRDDCKEQKDLHIALLTIAGQSRDKRLLPLVHESSQSKNLDIRAQSYWARLLLGDKTCLTDAISLCAQTDDFFNLLSPLLIRLGSTDTLNCYLHAAIASNTVSIDSKLLAMGLSGKANSIPWIIANATDSHTQAIAGLAFEMITGEKPTAIDGGNLPEPDTLDEYALEVDNSLIIPDLKSLDLTWKSKKQNFEQSSRYFLGRKIKKNNLIDIPDEKKDILYFKQQQILELTLVNPEKPLNVFFSPRI